MGLFFYSNEAMYSCYSFLKLPNQVKTPAPRRAKAILPIITFIIVSFLFSADEETVPGVGVNVMLCAVTVFVAELVEVEVTTCVAVSVGEAVGFITPLLTNNLLPG